MTQRVLPSIPSRLSARRVLIVAGGWSPEQDVSREGGVQIAAALKRLGHSVEVFDPPRDLEHIVAGIKTSFQGQGPDIVFNILHGPEGEDGAIQAVFDFMNVPYTFSGHTASAAAMDKALALMVAKGQGVLHPRGAKMALQTYLDKGWDRRPHIVKPLDEGSSFGVIYVEETTDVAAVLKDWSYGSDVLVEDYIPGREIQVATFGAGEGAVALDAVELLFEGPIFDFEPKYTPGKATHVVPPDVPADVRATLLNVAQTMHRTLGCRGTTRSDFRYDASAPKGKQVYFLEINTQPGMTAISLVPDIAKHYGWTYDDVITFLLTDALQAFEASGKRHAFTSSAHKKVAAL